VAIVALASCFGAIGTVGVASDRAAAGDAELGRALYTNCATCHGAEGQGGFGPAIAGNANLEYQDFLIAYVAKGSRRMPPFEQQFSPREMAAVLSHVRTSWGNSFGPLTEADVQAVLDGEG